MNESEKYLKLDINAKFANILWPNTLFNAVCLVTGLIGNGYVLYINKFKLKDKAESRYFIPYLAIVDACACLITCVCFILRTYHLYFPWDGPCKGFFFGAVVTAFSSAFLLLAIAIYEV